MGREALLVVDLGLDPDRLAVDRHRFSPLHKSPAAGACCLVPDKDYRVARIPQPVEKVMDHPASGSHAAGGNDYSRDAASVQSHRLLDCADASESAARQGIVDQSLEFFVVLGFCLRIEI